MKLQKMFSLILGALMLISACIVPVVATEAPTVYFDINFEDMTVGPVASGTEIGPNKALWLGANQNIAEVDGNKVLRTDKAAGTTGNNPDHCLYLFRAMGASNLSLYGSDFVVSWDLFVSDDDGKDFNLVAARSPNSSRKWAPSSFLKRSNEQGEGYISYHELAENKVKTSEGTVKYGQWNRIAVIGHYAAEGDVSTYDIYVNGNLIAGGVKMWYDTDRFTIGKLVGSDATPADCYQMIDNIKCYSGNQLMVGDAPETPDDEPVQPVAPTLYFNIDFNDMAVGAVASGTQVGNNNALWLGSNQNIAIRYGNDKALRTDKAAGSTGNNPDHCLYLFRAMGASNLSLYGSDFVVSWDLFVSDDDGNDFNLIAARSPDSSRKWAPSTFLKVSNANGEGHVSYRDAETDTQKTTEGTIKYGQWNQIAIIAHPAVGDSQIASYDIYVNGTVIAEGVKMWFDTDRFTIGKLVGSVATPADCYQMIDNIKCYSGSKICTNEELGIATSATAFEGVQESAVANGTYNVRFIGAVDALTYENVGFEVLATYTEGGETKTKNISKNASCVYNTITVHNDAGIAETYANADGDFLYALTIQGIPATLDTVVFEVLTYNTKDGVKTVDSKTVVTYRNGVFDSVVVA